MAKTAPMRKGGKKMTKAQRKAMFLANMKKGKQKGGAKGDPPAGGAAYNMKNC